MADFPILIANRGEIAIRIARAAAALGLRTVGIHSADDALSLHVKATDSMAALSGRGAAAYLAAEEIVAFAAAHGCAAIHPGYGFLSENAAFARLCAQSGIAFIGPDPATLELFGDKTSALALAQRLGVPVIRGTHEGSAEAIGAFLAGLGSGAAIVIKAAAGGGGRGMRIVREPGEVAGAVAACRAEAERAFGDGTVYAEELLTGARHIEVQVIGDGAEVAHLGERECTIQRRHQKLIEIAPSPFLDGATRAAIIDAALLMAREARYRSLGTFEFLVTQGAHGPRFAFIEANPRLQVEHTVTEEVTGIDLVAAQIRLAQGASRAQAGIDPAAPPAPRGFAIQLRVNAETLSPAGDLRAETGTITAFEVPTGPGVRVDASGYRGFAFGAAFDTLCAKLIVHAPQGSFADAARKASRALAEFRIEGLATNLPLLRALVARAEFSSGAVHTRFVEDNIAELAAAHAESRFFGGAGVAEAEQAGAGFAVIPGTVAIAAPMSGVVHSLGAGPGDRVIPGQPVAVIEAMKMQHELRSEAGGEIAAVLAAPGDTVSPGQPLFLCFPRDTAESYDHAAETPGPAHIRADLAEMLERRRAMTDEGRPGPVAKRHALGMRTARENIADLVDEGSFIEYGVFTLANQRARRSRDELLRLSPNDGVVTGLGTINAGLFGEEAGRAAIMSYDWTVFAGTQGYKGHEKTNRLIDAAQKLRLPFVLMSEGGGGRPGDDWGAAHLNGVSFIGLARLSGLVPIVGINNRYCFAGNAALLGMCDVIIATKSSSIGMGGPAMIEGGGLGQFHPSEVGPAQVQFANGVIDILVEDEAEAVATAKRYLAYFQGPLAAWEAADQRLRRHVVPEDRVRSYETRDVIRLLADTGSVLELRAGFGLGAVTALARIEGRTVGVIASNPNHLGGAIDADAADKSSRFMQLCDAFDLPIIMLCDTPGFMVGPDVERTAQVRHAARLYTTAANLQVPIFSVVLRKGYGLGAQGATGGSFHAPVWIVSWPSGEFGGMNLEGAVHLAYAKELEAIADPAEREALYARHLSELYQLGKALTVAEFFEIDDVIDPADTRRWILRGLKSIPPRGVRETKRRPSIDPW